MGITIPQESGVIIDRYQLLEEVGQGGMATVYRGRDTVLQREVAVKVLHPHLAKDSMHRERFRGEAQAVARLHHPGIVKVYDFSSEDEDKSPAYIVMEFVRGQTLQALLEKREFPLCELAACLITTILPALEHAHQQNIIHRDLKPENVLIQEDGTPKLTDFGLARVLDSESITRTGTILGSPAYMAPEQVEGLKGDERTDLFSLGVILYRLVCQQHPFQSSNPVATMQAVVTSKYQDPELVRPGIGRELYGIIRRVLAKQPQERYSSVSELQQDLMRYLHASGLEQPQAILRSYLLNPIDTEPQIKQRILSHLKKRAEECLHEKRFAAALDQCNRVLALAPNDLEVTELIDKISNRDNWKKHALLIAAGTSLLTLFFAAGWLLLRGIAPPTPKKTPLTQNHTHKKTTTPQLRNAVLSMKSTPNTNTQITPPTPTLLRKKTRISITKKTTLPPPRLIIINNQNFGDVRLRRYWRSYQLHNVTVKLRYRYNKRLKRFFLHVKAPLGQIQLGKQPKESLPPKRIHQLPLHGHGPFVLHYFKTKSDRGQWMFKLPSYIPPPTKKRTTPPPIDTKSYPKRIVYFGIQPWAHIFRIDRDGEQFVGKSPVGKTWLTSGPKAGRIWKLRIHHPDAPRQYVWVLVPEDQTKRIHIRFNPNDRWRPLSLKHPFIRKKLAIQLKDAQLRLRSNVQATLLIGKVNLGPVGPKTQTTTIRWLWRSNSRKIKVSLVKKERIWTRTIRFHSGKLTDIGFVRLRSLKKDAP